MLEIKGDGERLTEKKRYDDIQPSRKSCRATRLKSNRLLCSRRQAPVAR